MQLVAYNVTAQQFTDIGSWSLPEWIYGDTFYAQKEDALWMVSRSGDALSVFNLSSSTFKSHWVDIPVNVSTTSCIATASSSNSNSHSLFILGGDDGRYHLDAVIMYNLSSSQWSLDVPPMNDKRAYASCIVDAYNVLYAIAGHGTSYLSSIEVFDANTPNLADAEWEYLTQTLTVSPVQAKSALHGDTIFVMGGYSWSSYWTIHDEVHVIDTRTHSVSKINASLPFGMWGMCAVSVHHVLYSFGGSNTRYNHENQLDQWMTLNLEHLQPLGVVFAFLYCVHMGTLIFSA